MAGALSQDEIDDLLSGVDAAYAADMEESKGLVAESCPDKSAILSQDDIKYLLKKIGAADKAAGEKSQELNTENRREKFSREQLREISLIHEKFARIAAKSLSAKLRRTFKITVASVDQLYMGEFLRTIPSPATLGIINMASRSAASGVSLKGSAVLEIDPLITFAIIDKICCSQIVSTKSWHELTDNERFIMTKIYAGLLDDLRDAWYKVVDLNLRLEEIETEPRFIKIAPPMECVALITLEANMDNVEGMINFCIPYPVIEPVLEKL